MRPLTPSQRQILDHLVSTTDAGRQANYREIMGAFGFGSTNAVATHLRQLEAKGYIRCAARVAARSITILHASDGAPYLTPLERYRSLCSALGCLGWSHEKVIEVALRRRVA